MCTDLLPFSAVSGAGFSYFFSPGVHLPSEETLSTIALCDLYRALKAELKNILAEVLIVFDKYHGRPLSCKIQRTTKYGALATVCMRTLYLIFYGNARSRCCEIWPPVRNCGT